MTKIKLIKNLIQQLKNIQQKFYQEFGVNDIISNSKIFEVLIADKLGHNLIPGHSGSKDAKDFQGGEYEYKHYKETSSNHTWTFNDFTDSTINRLYTTKAVIFAHINDLGRFPKFDWYYLVSGKKMANYLKLKTAKIRNKRKMINISSRQIGERIKIQKSSIKNISESGKYSNYLKEIFETVKKLEKITGIKEILTSNKFWEMLVSLKLKHQVLSEQSGHDAKDNKGNYYEYKVAKDYSWNFQDISNAVLNKYLQDKGIILAVVDKEKIKVLKIYEALPGKVIKLLRKKLKEKKARFRAKGKIIRRLQVSLSKNDLDRVKAKTIYF